MKEKCMICGKEVEKDKHSARGYSCNGAVLGEYIELKGHPMCVNNVDRLVVIPNRIRLIEALQERG